MAFNKHLNSSKTQTDLAAVQQHAIITSILDPLCVMRTVVTQNYHLKNYYIVNIISNTEHATMETLRDIVLIDKSVYESLTLNKITIMAILVMLYSCELVDIIGDTNENFIHRTCSGYNYEILINIFLFCNVLISCGLILTWLFIVIQFIIKWMMICQLIHAITARTSGMTRVCNGIRSHAISITAGCERGDIGSTMIIGHVYYYACDIGECKNQIHDVSDAVAVQVKLFRLQDIEMTI